MKQCESFFFFGEFKIWNTLLKIMEIPKEDLLGTFVVDVNKPCHGEDWDFEEAKRVPSGEWVFVDNPCHGDDWDFEETKRVLSGEGVVVVLFISGKASFFFDVSNSDHRGFGFFEEPKCIVMGNGVVDFLLPCHGENWFEEGRVWKNMILVLNSSHDHYFVI